LISGEEDSLLPLVAQETFYSVPAVSDDAAAVAPQPTD
jgi:hypothetical protein